MAQRITGIALGYEDLNDHDDLRHDPLLALLAGKLEARRKGCAALAGKSTLNRLEHAPPGGEPGHYHRIDHDPDALQAELVELFIDLWEGKPPSGLVLDIDSIDDAAHGRQEGRFFHGYYGHYCFLRLYITCGGRPLFAQLRPGNADPTGDVTAPLDRIIARLRQEWPWLKILLRADSAYAREDLLAWCKDNRVDYVIGLARNSRLVKRIESELADAQAEAVRHGRPARRYTESHRHLLGPDRLRARLLLAGRHGEHHQGAAARSLLRPDFSLAHRRQPAPHPVSCFASILLDVLRRTLVGTRLARATAGTLRLKLLRIGDRVSVSVCRVKVAMDSAHPSAAAFEQVRPIARVTFHPLPHFLSRRSVGPHAPRPPQSRQVT